MHTWSHPLSDVSDFLDQVRNAQVLAVDVSTPAQTRPFVPIHALRRYLTEGTIRKLLVCFHRSTNDWKAIQQGYLAVFTILISIGKGAYITHFIHYDSLADERLPFRGADDWPPDCVEFFQKFADAQWQFCAQPLRRDRLNETRYRKEVIIPIKSSEPLKVGPDSCTYKVGIYPGYNFLAEQDENGKPLTNTFVLKTCREKDAQYHHNEVDAYKALRHQNDVSRNMARFYGSWHQGQTYYMVLEYVGGGTLVDFFERVEPPTRKEDILKLWEELLDIVKPVARIHKLPDHDNRRQYWQGIHHDIKTSNILVSEPFGPSRFDVVFKLADLGLTDFELAVQKGKEVRRRDTHGTQMFTAPEYHRDEGDSFLERTILDAKPSKDIWSLGCVYSEAAVWSVLGMEGLKEYQSKRAAATDQVPKLRCTAYSGCFHDGEKVLQAVIDMHLRVRQERRRNDYVVHDVVTIIEDMLDEALSRPDAVDVYKRSRKALKTAKAWSNSQLEPPSDTSYPPIFRDDSDPFGRRQTPPEIPPEIAGTGAGLGMTGVPLGALASSPTSVLSKDFGPQPSPISPSSSNLTSEEKQTDPFDQTPHASYNGSPIAKRHPRPASEPFLGEDITSLPDATPKANGAGASTWRHSTPNPQRSTHAPSPRPVDSSSRAVVSSSAPGNGTERSKFPHVTIEEAWKWIARTKKGSNTTPLEGHEYLKRLASRDQIFLIDDSITMKSHWSKVRRAFETLAYLVKKYDPDGIEIRFTNTPSEEGRSKNREKLLEILDRITPAGQCDMGLALGKILERYHPEHTKPQKGLLSRWRKEKWGVNIYVLTDAVWEDDEEWLDGVVEPIKSLVDKLVDKGLTKGHVGIQFIQFGDDPVGTKRLKILDNELDKHAVTKDIVDTEPYEGNLYKMLLGSIDPAWDKYTPKKPSGSGPTHPSPQQSKNGAVTWC